MAEPAEAPAPNLPETNAEWKRQKNLENLARAREMLKLKKEREKAAKELAEHPPVLSPPEPEPYIIESNKESEEQPKRFFWAEPKFRAFRKREREVEETPMEPQQQPIVPPDPVEEPPLKKPKIEEESYWTKAKAAVVNHASEGAKILLVSLVALIAQTLAKKAHGQIEAVALPSHRSTYVPSYNKSRYLNPAEY